MSVPALVAGQSSLGYVEPTLITPTPGYQPWYGKGTAGARPGALSAFYYFTGILCKAPGALSCLSLCQAVQGTQSFD